MNPETITIDLSEWTRLAEVDQYAREHECTRAEAIRRLVNSGLSHWPHVYDSGTMIGESEEQQRLRGWREIAAKQLREKT